MIIKQYLNTKIRLGDQLKHEIKNYEKYYTQYRSILPKIYTYGKNWIIEEYLKPMTEEFFFLKTGISMDDWHIAIDQRLYDIQRALYHPATITNIKNIPLIKTAPIDKILIKLKILSNSDEYFDNSINKEKLNIYKKILKSDILLKIIEFSYKTRTVICDLEKGNLGISSDNQLKVLDFGLRFIDE